MIWSKELLARSPYFPRVPLTWRENLVWRHKVIRWGSASVDNARTLFCMCARDVLFYFSTFLWLLEPRPRPGRPSHLPFIPYPFQAEAIVTIAGCIERGEDYAVEKSRDMGATWSVLGVMDWCWTTWPKMRQGSFLCVSRTEDLAKNTFDPDSHFGKLKFLIDNVPGWLRPRHEWREGLLLNLETGSNFKSESANPDAGRQGRYSAALLDEFPAVRCDDDIDDATSHSTRCRGLVGTPDKKRGPECVMFKKIQYGKIITIRMHWSQHPLKSQGLEMRHGKPWSPWWQEQVDKAGGDLRKVAAEVDIDWGGAQFRFFQPEQIQRLIKLRAVAPTSQWTLEQDEQTFEPLALHPARGRPGEAVLKLWCPVDAAGQPPRDRNYIVSADLATGSISSGRGASSSVLSISDDVTREKIGELAVHGMPVYRFAELAYGVLLWFRGKDGLPYLIWECNGPGQTFRDRLIELKYRNFYYGRDEAAIAAKPNQKPGWWSTNKTKRTAFEEFERALYAGEYLTRSEAELRECLEYVIDDAGDPVHAASQQKDDPTQARDNHGDIVMSAVVLWKGIKLRTGSKVQRLANARSAAADGDGGLIALPGSPMALRRESLAAREQQAEEQHDFDAREFMGWDQREG